VWWSADFFTAMRATAGADRSRQHFESQLKGEQVVNLDVRCEEVIHWLHEEAQGLGLEDKIAALKSASALTSCS